MWSSSNQVQKPYTKIFWPIRCNDKPSGYLIGWNTRSFVACVVDIISDINLKDLENVLNKLSFDRRMLTCPIGPPRIIGEWINTKDSNQQLQKEQPQQPLHELDIWISMKRLDNGDPFLQKIYCNEYKFQTSSQIVLYDDASPYYYTSVPISFANTSNSTKRLEGASTTKSGNSVFVSVSSPTQESQPKQRSKSNPYDLESTFKQINCSNDIMIILNETIEKLKEKQKQQQDAQKDKSMDKQQDKGNNSSFFGLRLRKQPNVDIQPQQATNSTSPPQTSSTPSSPTQASHNSNAPTTQNRNIFFIMVVFFGQLLLKILNLPAPFFQGQKLKDQTSLGTHLFNRIEEIKTLYQQSKLKKKYWLNNNIDRSLNIEIKNKKWLIFIDVAMGILAGITLRYFGHLVLNGVARINYFLTNEMLKNLILWLMGWPAGFKLNENLDKFFGRLILYYIDKWNLITTTLSPHGGIILNIVCASGMFGLSFLISVIIDLFSIFTLHITVFYSVSARFYLLQLILLKSLWNLFRGVKYNPLRKRTDSCDFDPFQLLLGTLLFTLIIFLVPTTGVYYFFFATFKANLTIVMGLFSLVLHLLKSFPLVGLVKYLRDPKYLPFGVTFNVKDNQQQQQSNYSPPTSPTIFTTPTNPTNPVSSHQRNQSSPNVTSPILNQYIEQQQLQQQQQNVNDEHPLLPQQQQQQQQRASLLLSPLGGNKMNFGHRRNQSLQTSIYQQQQQQQSSQTQSMMSPLNSLRVSTQLEITYVMINIEPIHLATLFYPTVKLLSDTIQYYSPRKLIKSFFLGVPIK